MIKQTVFGLAGLFLIGCGTTPDSSQSVVGGILRSYEVGRPTYFVELDGAKGCVDLSLPLDEMKVAATRVGQRVSVRGTLRSFPDDPGLLYIEYNGRRIEMRGCGRNYLFVAEGAISQFRK